MSNHNDTNGDNGSIESDDDLDFPFGRIPGLGFVTAVGGDEDDAASDDSLGGFAEVSDHIATMLAAQYLDDHRFGTRADAILTLHGDVQESFYPASEDLERTGIDLIGLARAMKSGWLAPERVMGLIDSFRMN